MDYKPVDLAAAISLLKVFKHADTSTINSIFNLIFNLVNVKFMEILKLTKSLQFPFYQLNVL